MVARRRLAHYRPVAARRRPVVARRRLVVARRRVIFKMLSQDRPYWIDP